MSLFSIFGSLGLKTADFEAGWKRAGSVATKASDSIASTFKNRIAGAFTLGAVENWGRKMMDRVDGLKDAAENLGLTFQEVQELESAAIEGNSSLDRVGPALDKFTMARAKAVGGNAGAVAAFTELGISMEQVRNESVSNLTLWRAIGTEIGDSNPSLVQRVALMQLLGKSGAQLVPVLKELRKPSPTDLIDAAQAETLDEMKKGSSRIGRKALNASVAPAAGAVSAAENMMNNPLATLLTMGGSGTHSAMLGLGKYLKDNSLIASLFDSGVSHVPVMGKLREAESSMGNSDQMARDLSAASKSLEEIKAIIKYERDATSD